MRVSNNRNAHRRRSRGGYLMVELLVAAGILLAAMTFLASMAPRLGRLWQQTARQRAAMTELSNQLEWLTRLSKDDVRTELDALQPSAHATTALPGAKLDGQLVDDAAGPRVVLRLSWSRRPAGPPIELVGWLNPATDPPPASIVEEEQR